MELFGFFLLRILFIRPFCPEETAAALRYMDILNTVKALSQWCEALRLLPGFRI